MNTEIVEAASATSQPVPRFLKALHVGAVMQFLPRGISAAVRFQVSRDCPPGCRELIKLLP